MRRRKTLLQNITKACRAAFGPVDFSSAQQFALFLENLTKDANRKLGSANDQIPHFPTIKTPTLNRQDNVPLSITISAPTQDPTVTKKISLEISPREKNQCQYTRTEEDVSLGGVQFDKQGRPSVIWSFNEGSTEARTVTPGKLIDLISKEVLNATTSPERLEELKDIIAEAKQRSRTGSPIDRIKGKAKYPGPKYLEY